MIDVGKIRFTECGDGLLHHTLGIRSVNQSRRCNWCARPLKYSNQHLCYSCRNRNRLGSLYAPYRGISKLSHLTPRIKHLNTPELQHKVKQVMLKTCEQSNFFKSNYYHYFKSKPENQGNFTKLSHITRICLAYTLDYIEEPHHYNDKVEIYYRWLTRAVTQYMNYPRKYYSALPTTVSDYFGSKVLEMLFI